MGLSSWNARGARARLSFAVVVGEIEGGHAFEIIRPLEHLLVPQRAHSVVIAGAPMLLHGQSREFVVLRVAFVVLGAIYQVHNAVDLPVGDRTEQPDLL